MTSTTLQRIAAGDGDAVADCLERYGGLVWSLARRLMPSTADAEDAVQEVFLELWRCAGRFDPAVASEPTFIAMIARRRLLDHRRKRGRLPAHQPLATAESVAAPASRPAAELSEESASVMRSLSNLEENRRRVLELSIRDGCSHERIAEFLGMPLGTVKSHARRGLVQLRELLSRREARPAEGTS